MKIVRYIFVFGLMLQGLLSHSAVARPLTDESQPAVVVDSIQLEIYFKQGYSIYNPQRADNGIRFDRFIEQVEACLQDSLCSIRSIQVVGAASPEGLVRLNKRLSENRATRVKSILLERLPQLEPLIETSAVGVDWAQLQKYIESHDIPHRDQLLRIITKTPEITYTYNGRARESRKLQLIYLNDGADWNFLMNEVFPQLRRGSTNVSMIIERRIVEEPKEEPKVEEPVVEEPAVEEPREEVVEIPQAAPKSYIPWVAVKTNLLSDVLAIPHLGVEFCLGNRFSLSAEWSYSHWKSDNASWYWQTYGGDVAFRYWFGKNRTVEDRLTGHHIGLFGQMRTFDFEWGNRGYQAPDWVYAGGVEYGYSMPLGRRLNLDFSVAAGYISGQFYEYLPIDDHYVWQVTKSIPRFCLTKAEVTLSWLIGRNRVTKSTDLQIDKPAKKAKAKKAKAEKTTKTGGKR